MTQTATVTKFPTLIIDMAEKKQRYNKTQFYEDEKLLMKIVGKSIAYVSNDVSTFRVSFADEILGLNIDVYLSKKTVMIRSKSNNEPYIMRKLTWEAIANIFCNMYKYI